MKLDQVRRMYQTKRTPPAKTPEEHLLDPTTMKFLNDDMRVILADTPYAELNKEMGGGISSSQMVQVTGNQRISFLVDMYKRNENRGFDMIYVKEKETVVLDDLSPRLDENGRRIPFFLCIESAECVRGAGDTSRQIKKFAERNNSIVVVCSNINTRSDRYTADFILEANEVTLKLTKTKYGLPFTVDQCQPIAIAP